MGHAPPGVPASQTSPAAAAAAPATATAPRRASSEATSADPVAESVRLDAEVTPRAEASDLVVRDQHGEVEIGNPPTPVVDDEEELQALEYQQENESMCLS
jgi:hypothetical protein